MLINNEIVRLEEIFKIGIPRFYLNIFIIAFGSSMLLMASGLFLGTISIDDELHVTSRYFEGIGRGSWGLQLITYLLPGQLGISFAPIFFGCGIYALSTTILISLWNLRDQTIANFCAAIIGCFPYFASMMTFDVVQIAYPIGFVLIVSSLLPVFRESTTYLNLIFGALGFSLAFACYQGLRGQELILDIFNSCGAQNEFLISEPKFGS